MVSLRQEFVFYGVKVDIGGTMFEIDAVSKKRGVEMVFSSGDSGARSKAH